jgi:hypothetical protein
MRRHSRSDAIRLNDPRTVLGALDDLLPRLRERTTEAELLDATVADLAGAGFKDGRPVGFSSFLMPLGGYQIRDEWHGGLRTKTAAFYRMLWGTIHPTRIFTLIVGMAYGAWAAHVEHQGKRVQAAFAG